MESYNRFLEENADDVTRAAAAGHSAVICLATPGVPVIYVSDVFESHTGYKPSEVIGKSLSILQGPMTEAQAIEDFRFLIENGVPGTVRITNYRKDKTPFVHECALRPIKNAQGNVSHFIAIQTPVAG
ncbi:PAS domain-containing protein [Cognatiyoonia sp. IB215446]|uniref:PAS domain-containing protein n=1 Tax=Cognatiyoonia sp. IB215446 TaxID=3097355 RepID=UPI002A146381|nr:PAS domain-containing protein [Cognatiyoonia sp. IB215446]MDX8346858.1 PAS domain-containing protein [Cognatiyoonia sp. IB215446]